MGRKKISDEEKKRRHRERSKKRRERIKNNPEESEREKIKQHIRYEARKSRGDFKLIKDLTPRETRLRQKKWRENSKRYRFKQKLEQQLRLNLEMSTPPHSDIENEDPNPINMANTPKIESSRQKIMGRKIMYGKRANCYRLLKTVRKENKNLRKQLDKYKKRYYRQKNKTQKNVELTPNTKVETMLQGITVPPQVKKRLLFGEVLNQELTSNFQILKDHRSKQIFTKVISGRLLRKYRLLHEAVGFLSYGLSRSHKNKKKHDLL